MICSADCLAERYATAPSCVGWGMTLRLGLVALLLVVGCGSVGPGSAAQPSPPTAALAAWETFPADRMPRPIVLLGIDSPGQAFTTVSKVSALCRLFQLNITLPAEIPKQSSATWANGTTATYTAVSATEAFAALKQAPGASGDMCSGAVPLSVTAARFGDAKFATDRGMAKISAWLFTVQGAQADFLYPALPSSACWRGGLIDRQGSGGATVSADGMSIDFGFVGGECDASYQTAVAESSKAVAVVVHATWKPGVDYCSAVGIERSVKVSLASPLGGRVLLTASGDPAVVCPEAIRSC
jgi:hypothetical protein